ncbi:MAG: DUF885 family protein [Alphaproteobacteria bacterium]|nr:DUF885 family protein [Alphaproteobacteria bacterium]
MTPAAKLVQLIDDYWAFELAESPFRAEEHGVEPARLLNGVAPADYERRAEAYKGFLDRVRALDRVRLSEEDRLNADLLEFILKHDVALSAYREWRAPFLSDSGFHSGIVRRIKSATLRTEADYRRYLDRMAALPEWIDQQIANMRVGIAEGYTQPAEIMAGIMPSFEALVVDAPAAHPLHEPLENVDAALGARKGAAVRREGEKILAEKVLPAYRALLTFMQEEYLPAARPVVGVSSTTDGAGHYAALVRYYTTRDDATPDAIHQLGLKEVARIRKEMDGVIKDAGFKGTFAEFQNFLRTDDQFYAETPEELLKEAAWISKDIDGKLPSLFGKLPRQPYSVEPVPDEIAPNYTSGRYVGAALDSDRGGQYWVNIYDLKQRPLYEYPALSLHEAVPGHHLQNALSAELENVPTFRQDFYPHAFGEGWGLYSEKLGLEMDIYKTPYDHFGRLSFEMWRAARLVIDTGLHSQGWTRQQAMDYLAGNTALSMRNVQVEIDRYIAWPGQALAYKIGELTFLETRAKAEEALGDDFDVRAFHDAALSAGGVPMDILRQRIDAWIAAEKAKGG